MSALNSYTLNQLPLNETLVTGDLIDLAGSTSVSTASSASLDIVVNATGDVAASATGLATASQQTPLSGSASGTATAQSVASVTKTIEGSASSSGLTNAGVALSINPSGSISASAAIAQAPLSLTVALSGNSAPTASTSAVALVEKPISGSLASTASAAANASKALNHVGSASGGAVASGSSSLTVNMGGAASTTVNIDATASFWQALFGDIVVDGATTATASKSLNFAADVQAFATSGATLYIVKRLDGTVLTIASIGAANLSRVISSVSAEVNSAPVIFALIEIEEADCVAINYDALATLTDGGVYAKADAQFVNVSAMPTEVFAAAELVEPISLKAAA